MQFDVIISGAGIVGLATALKIKEKKPDWRIAVLEKEQHPAMHQSSRNSGVIHSGIYYRPGSLRAVNCKRGYDLLLNFCRTHQIPHEICGKIIVAVEPAERTALDNIYQRGIQNQLIGIKKISGAEAREIEPHVNAVEAVWVPQSGIVDYGAVARKYAELFEKMGGALFFQQKVQQVLEQKGGVVVEANNSFQARVFV
ncbi:MAG TPA: L-2-hydroxyglutarate oxidase, partial [Saprospirales bacterium]|nr:L-2-hydroxyglutarate oxidase [Saprospirales bacterium]